jgi:hypothetical protein
MKKVTLGLATASAAFVASAAEAQTRPGFELGAEVFDYSYRERFEGEVIVKDDGTFGGITFGYVETIGSGMFLRARLSTDFGSVDYSSDDGRLENVSQTIGQLELHLGRDFTIGSGTTITPFIGIGSRVLEDKSGGKETELGALGYDREISYAYVPVGVAAALPVSGRSELILGGHYNWVVGGEAKSQFSDLDPELPNVRVDLDNGHGFEASATLRFPLGSHAIAFGPFVRHWNLDRSTSFILTDPEGSGESIELFEPRNRTTEMGLRLSFSF